MGFGQDHLDPDMCWIRVNLYKYVLGEAGEVLGHRLYLLRILGAAGLRCTEPRRSSSQVFGR